MKNKINIAELLKDCPKGMELYSPLCGTCRVIDIYDGLGFDVICGDDTIYNFLYDGRYNIMGECCIFPSEENRDWGKFQRPFKDGDIISNGNYIAIFCKIGTPCNCIPSDVVYYYCYYSQKFCKFKKETDFGIGISAEFKYATEEEKQKLFDAIKDNGYKWNSETKTLEKLPKFKVGDRIILKDNPHNIPSIRIKAVTKSQYILENEGFFYISSADEKYVLEDKFDITTLKPFDKVLVRDNNAKEWVISLFSHCNELEIYKYSCVNGGGYAQCVPYEENKHLFRTTDDCDEYYKTW